MSDLMKHDGPVAKMLSRLFMVPPSRIQNWLIVVQYDAGTAMVHTLCCEPHAREALAELARTEPISTQDHYDPEGN